MGTYRGKNSGQHEFQHAGEGASFGIQKRKNLKSSYQEKNYFNGFFSVFLSCKITIQLSDETSRHWSTNRYKERETNEKCPCLWYLNGLGLMWMLGGKCHNIGIYLLKNTNIKDRYSHISLQWIHNLLFSTLQRDKSLKLQRLQMTYRHLCVTGSRECRT